MSFWNIVVYWIVKKWTNIMIESCVRLSWAGSPYCGFCVWSLQILYGKTTAVHILALWCCRGTGDTLSVFICVKKVTFAGQTIDWGGGLKPWLASNSVVVKTLKSQHHLKSNHCLIILCSCCYYSDMHGEFLFTHY